MVSKTRIDKHASRKTNEQLQELIINLKKQSKLKLANLLARPRRQRVEVNLDKLDKETKDGDLVIVPGKVLGKGSVGHKLTIAALSFSEEARKKLKDCKFMGIAELAGKEAKLVY